MGNVIKGVFTLKDVMQFTYSMYRNRFTYKRRDVLKRITIKEIRKFKPDRIGAPLVLYRIVSSSYPNYKPYFDRKSGKKYQRKILHEYDVVLELDELSLNTSNWKGRLGSGKKWISRPPQKQIRSIYKETRKKWSKKIIAEHREKRGLFVDVGDWNSRVKGINADFRFRCAYVYRKYGHLYGYQHMANIPAGITNPRNIVFFPKHLINIIEILMNSGVLKN